MPYREADLARLRTVPVAGRRNKVDPTLLASAKFDEREYPDPEEFVWDRRVERLLAFGRGQHFCLGVHLARLEITILVREWLRRVPDFHIDAASAYRPPSSFQWGWNSLPVEV